MKLFYLFSIFFLLGCMSSEKQRYDSLLKDQNPSLNNSGKSSKEIAYWKNASQFNENNFQFVTKQMKEVIKNYSKMKKQLVKIESKLDNLLNQMALAIEEYSSRENDDMKDSEDEEEDDDEDEEENDEEEESIENDVIDSKKSAIYHEDITDDKNIFLEEDDKENADSKKQPEDNKKNTSPRKQPADDKGNSSSRKQQKDSEDSADSQQPEKNGEKSSSSQRKKSAFSKVYKVNSGSIKVRPLTEAKDLFEKKLYESAISKFQQYRDNNPKGSYYPEATYYIGQSFKNLKMPIEADIFFKEIISSYPKSLWASRAKKLLEE